MTRVLGLGGRIRISTAILALVFILALVIYLLVRPGPKMLVDTTRPTSSRPADTSSKAPTRSSPSVRSSPAPTTTVTPRPSASAISGRGSASPSPSPTEPASGAVASSPAG